MVCPFCLHKKTIVYNSRHTSRLNVTWRRRRCLQCNQEFTTHETIEVQKILRVGNGTTKRSNTTDFSRARLLLSLLKVCDHRPDHGEAAYLLCDAIEQKLLRYGAEHNNVVLTDDVVKICLTTLKHFDATAYLKYLTYHTPSILDIKTLKKRLRG